MFFILLHGKEVDNRRQRSRSSRYTDIDDGLFTRGIRNGPRSLIWPDYEVEILNAARIAGKSDDDIRELVEKLEADRKNTLQHVLEHYDQHLLVSRADGD